MYNWITVTDYADQVKRQSYRICNNCKGDTDAKRGLKEPIKTLHYQANNWRKCYACGHKTPISKQQQEILSYVQKKKENLK